jgi:ribonuclease P protein component
MPARPTPPARLWRFPRACRLKRGFDFARLKNQGRRLVCGSVILNWLVALEGASRRVGIVTSRHVGGAVVRNRARRLLREAWRRHQHSLPPSCDLVLVARHSIARKKLAEVEQDFLNGLRRAGLSQPK